MSEIKSPIKTAFKVTLGIFLAQVTIAVCVLSLLFGVICYFGSH